MGVAALFVDYLLMISVYFVSSGNNLDGSM